VSILTAIHHGTDVIPYYYPRTLLSHYGGRVVISPDIIITTAAIGNDSILGHYYPKIQEGGNNILGYYYH